MSDLILPPWVRISGGRYDFLSNTAAANSIFTGAIRSLGRTGDRVKVAINTQNASHREDEPSRALLETIRAQLRGQANRIWYTDPGYSCRGSFPDGELLTNNTFASGIGTWSGVQADVSLSDRIMRAKTNIGGQAFGFKSPPWTTSVTQNAPHVMRAFASAGRHANSLRVLAQDSNLNNFEAVVSGTTQGLGTISFVPTTGSVFAEVYDTSTGHISGDYIDCSYVSLSRCALVDNGPNILLQSDTLGTTWTQIGLSALSSDAATAPDGTVTADTFVEDSSNSSHGITQSQSRASVAADICAFGYFVRGSGTRNIRLTAGNDGADFGSAVFDLGAGTFGTVANAGTATNARAFMEDAGGGLYFCCVVARLPAAATIATFVQMHDGSSAIYTGNGTSSISGWRVGAAVSSVPTRGAQTTTTALPTGAVQTGPGYYTKGWPASTNGLLLYGDWVQIGNQLNKVVAPVNSDAAGLAYLQLAYPMRTAPSDNDPVIITNPFGRMVLTSNEGGYDFSPEGSNHDFDLVEALDQ